jgi:hypothetical protein
VRKAFFRSLPHNDGIGSDRVIALEYINLIIQLKWIYL